MKSQKITMVVVLLTLTGSTSYNQLQANGGGVAGGIVGGMVAGSLITSAAQSGNRGSS